MKKKIELFLRNIKQGFATNSSSYHSMIMMNEEDRKKWVNGEIEVDGYSHDEWFDDEYAEHESGSLAVGDNTVYVYCKYGSDY